jgi:hypothetical protein
MKPITSCIHAAELEAEYLAGAPVSYVWACAMLRS